MHRPRVRSPLTTILIGKTGLLLLLLSSEKKKWQLSSDWLQTQAWKCAVAMTTSADDVLLLLLLLYRKQHKQLYYYYYYNYQYLTFYPKIYIENI